MSDSTSSVPATLGAPSSPSTPDVSIGSTTNLCTSGRSVISVKGVKFIPNGHAISTTITETFKERQDATGYSWKNVSQSTRDFYRHEFMKLYQWTAAENAIIKHTWNKVTSTLYNKKMHVWRKGKVRPTWIPKDVWSSLNTHWSSEEWLKKSRIAAQNRCSETGGPGTGPSKHTGGSRSTVEHTIKLAVELGRPPNSWDIFKKLHLKKDGDFVDAKSISVQEKMEVAMAVANSNSSDDSQEVDVNRLYFEVVGGEKKGCVYGLGSQALTLYPDSNSPTSRTLHAVPDHAAEERIKVLEEEMLRMRETQERNLQQCVEQEVQQRVEQEVQQRVEQEVQQRVAQEVSRLSQQSEDRLRSLEEQWKSMMGKMGLSPRPSGVHVCPSKRGLTNA